MRFGSLVQGWYTDEEGERLVELASTAPGEIVELGTAWGKSASYILARTNRSMTCVDLWGEDDETYVAAYEYFNDLLEENSWKDRVTLIRARTQDAALGWDKPIGLLHIDADHEYEGVRADFQLWAPHIAPGGAIALHDMQYAGPSRVVQELIEPDERWVDRKLVFVQWSARKEA